MKRETALKILGGKQATAKLLGITTHAIDYWPENLPRVTSDRILAAKVRLELRAEIARNPQFALTPLQIEVLSDDNIDRVADDDIEAAETV